MKLLCETMVRYRLSSGASTARAVKSTVALGRHPPNKPDAKLFLILFTQANKTGTRYKITGNINRIFTKFAHEGKATISLLQPEHDLHIRCDAIQLKCFLHALRLGLDGKSLPNGSMQTLATTAIPQSSHPVTTMTILERSQFPVRSLPRTLKNLTINGLQRTRVDSQILFLKNLTSLNLSDNVIKEIPKQLGELQLVEIDLSKNSLSEMTGSKQWLWLEGRILQASLVSLNLSGNNLTHFPYSLVKLLRLTVLKLDNNAIAKLPFAIRRMQTLRFLHLSQNRLSSLPHTLTRCALHTLDISNNESLQNHVPAEQPTPVAKSGVPELWELAARSVSAHRIPYSATILPAFLIDMLEETALCPCGRLSFSSQVYEKCQKLSLRCQLTIASCLASTLFGDSVFCSARCFHKYTMK